MGTVVFAWNQDSRIDSMQGTCAHCSIKLLFCQKSSHVSISQSLRRCQLMQSRPTVTWGEPGPCTSPLAGRQVWRRGHQEGTREKPVSHLGCFFLSGWMAGMIQHAHWPRSSATGVKIITLFFLNSHTLNKQYAGRESKKYCPSETF